jgi:hypothetical protein
VIGYEQRLGRTSLLLFDPSVSGEKLLGNLQRQQQAQQQAQLHGATGAAGSGAWQRSVKRGLHTLKHGAYQVVFVSGVMTAEERERSKILVARADADSFHEEIR